MVATPYIEWFTIVALFWKLEGLGGDFKPGHVYTFSVSSNLEVEAQSH